MKVWNQKASAILSKRMYLSMSSGPLTWACSAIGGKVPTGFLYKRKTSIDR